MAAAQRSTTASCDTAHAAGTDCCRWQWRDHWSSATRDGDPRWHGYPSARWDGDPHGDGDPSALVGRSHTIAHGHSHTGTMARSCHPSTPGGALSRSSGHAAAASTGPQAPPPLATPSPSQAPRPGCNQCGNCPACQPTSTPPPPAHAPTPTPPSAITHCAHEAF